MKTRQKNFEIRYFILLTISALLIFQTPLPAVADIMGGNTITDRFTRDGVVGATYIDMIHTIKGDSWLTGWNIWADSYAFMWPYSLEARSLRLIIFRSVGTDSIEVVAKSNFETVNEWNRSYHFDLSTPIQVKAGDFIGWYDKAGVSTPGGVIAFDWGQGGSCLTRWAYNVEISGTSPLSAFYPGEARIYSINVEGIPDQGTSVPEPATLLLLSLGIAGLAVNGRKFKRQ